MRGDSEKVKKQTKDFTDPIIREVDGCSLGSNGPNPPNAPSVLGAMKALVAEGADSICWICDLQDPQTNEALAELKALLLAKHVKLLVFSYDCEPGEMLQSIIDESGGALEMHKRAGGRSTAKGIKVWRH